MFDSLDAYQHNAVTILRDAVMGGTFPQASLFAGPKDSLRMTSALETARVLSCEKNGDDGCDCPSCRAFSSLLADNVVIMSQRENEGIANAYLNLYKRLGSDLSKRLLIRNLRIVLLQYHGALLESATKTQNATFALAGNLNDMLIDLEGDKELTEKERKRRTDDIAKTAKQFFASENKDTSISIAQVRAIDQWCHQTTVGKKKRFVIIEGIEDSNVNSRNSLLKILEEPPYGVYFILLSSHSGRIMPTILSRVRKVMFEPLTEEQVHAILAPLEGKGHASTIGDFLLCETGSDINALKAMAEEMAICVTEKRYLSSDRLLVFMKAMESNAALDYFLKELVACFEGMFLEKRLSPAYAHALSHTVSSMESQARLYNQNTRLLFESLYLKLMEVPA